MRRYCRSLWIGLALVLPALTLFTLLGGVSAGNTPSSRAPRDVVVSEIAWMGTITDTNDEWLELANNTGEDIDLTGWQLRAADGAPHIALEGVIPAGGYFLLERTDDTAHPVLADQTYTGALENGGEVLTLTDEISAVIDVAGNGDGWFAGDNTTKATMLRLSPTGPGDEAASWGDGPVGGEPADSIIDGDVDGYGFSVNIDWTAGDGPGLAARAEDCDDAVGSTYPGAPEQLDVVDNDCDGEIDEDFVLGELDYQIYFNSETAAPAKGPTAESNEMEEALLALINGAETSIDVALYGFDRARLAEALVDAHNRGVTVRVVADYDSYHSSSYGPTFAALGASGIPVVVSPYVSYLQHNKFAVIDGTAVWTGSTNWTDTGLTYNINNAVVITSPHVATAYEMEFAEMYAGQFANSKTDNTPHVFTYTNAVMEIYFSPTDAVRQKVLETVTAASSSLDFAIFFWTDDPLGALVQSKVVTEGLAVSGVWDAVGAANSYSEDDRLCDSGVPLKTELFGGKVHHKFMVVDAGGAAPALIMGSTNWSASGFDGGNDENLLIIHSSEAAAAYAAEARALYDRLPAAAVCARISAEAGLAACNDELDNDFDGRVDGGDGDCAESTLALCTDSLDNDGDGWVDGADLGCYGVRTLHLPAVLRP